MQCLPASAAATAGPRLDQIGICGTAIAGTMMITVNTLAPGWFKTEQNKVLYEDEGWVEYLSERIPLLRGVKEVFRIEPIVDHDFDRRDVAAQQ